MVMMEVTSLVSHFLMSLGNQLDGLSPSMAPLLFLGEPLLFLLQPPMRLPEESGIIHHITV